MCEMYLNNAFELKGRTCSLQLLSQAQQQATLELIYFNNTHNIFRVIKSGKMRLVGHVARMGQGEVYTVLWLGNLRKRDHLEDPGVDRRIILRLIFRKWYVGYGLERSGSG